MSTSKQLFIIVLLVLVVPWTTAVLYRLLVAFLSHKAAFAAAFVAVPLVLASVVYWREYFSDFGYTVAEERLFTPYYDIACSDQLRVIGAIALLGLLPLFVTALLLPEFERPWVDAQPFGFVGFVYLTTVLVYSSTILFERARELYRRMLAPALIILASLMGAYSSYYATDPLDIAGWTVIMASIGIIAYGAALLLRAARSIADKKSKVEAEVAFAAEVQRQFLQSRQVRGGGVAAFALSRPTRQLGGDFFHLSRGGENRLVASVGDVSGHGFGAGLIMTMLKTSFENFLAFRMSLSRVFAKLNEQLAKQAGRSTFASLACVDIDAESGEGVLWNAGHLPLLHYRPSDGCVESVHAPGLALGLADEVAYSPKPLSVQPEDWLVLCSDGLVETRDEEGAVRGLEFFSEVVQEVLSRKEEPQAAAEAIMRSIGEVHQGPFLQDDATLIVMRFDPEEQQAGPSDGTTGKRSLL